MKSLKNFVFCFVVAASVALMPAKAAGPLVLAPGVAIGALEATLIGVTAAVAMGMISQAEGDAHAAEIEKMIGEIKTASAEAARAVMTEAAELINKTNTMLNTVEQGCAPGEKIVNGKIDNWRDLYRGQCGRLENSCCGSLRERIERAGYKVEHIDGGKWPAWRVMNQSGKVLCCLNWDKESNDGFEIFKKGTHKGQRQCSDLNDGDPCRHTEGATRFMPDPEGHSPRGGCQ
jgi:hypothetical protein